MESTFVIEEVSIRLYSLSLGNVRSCKICSDSFINFIDEQHIPAGSDLIFQTGDAYDCSRECNDKFLTALNDFKSISYVIKDKKTSHNPWQHASTVQNINQNSQFFINYEDAHAWSLDQASL